jgi:hypothetical protein
MSKTAEILRGLKRPEISEKEGNNAEILTYNHPLVISGEVYFQDPRPDLENDSLLWLQMFIDASKYSKKLLKNLWDMRVWGTRIIKGRAGFVLRPDVDPEGVKAWPDKQTYEKWRNKLLMPYRAQIAVILKNLQEWESEGDR